jgi:hypothetical protein
MKPLIPVSLLGFLLYLSAQEPPHGRFQEVMDAYLSRTPMGISYHYSFTDGSFQQDTSGTMVILDSGKFRLDFWDKVYGTDGASLYLHDRNTHQTVIDSLRWTDMNLWVRLLQGELPTATLVRPGTPSAPDMLQWNLSHESPWWSANVVVDSISGMIREIQVSEDTGWEHRVRLDDPERRLIPDPQAFLRLQDLPGIRLDLRTPAE